jgi:nucleotide-binding universal stress UspA family protein
MTPFTKILVPTDFSEGAEAAMRIASDLSFRFAIPMTLVYVFEPTDYPLPNGFVVFTSQQVQHVTEEIERRLAQARRSALDAGGAHSVTTRHLQGWAAGEITQFAKEGGFDLIVMGTHGRSGLKHLLLGSVAEHVVRTAPCPVLTVRKPEKA